MSLETGNLQAALEYIQRDWRIFPLFYVLKDGTCSCQKAGCKRIGKHPIIKNGVLAASSDEAQVRQWWTQTPWANIGLACGHDGLIVVDVDEGTDKKTGQPKVGPASLSALVAANAPLPATLTARTGGGGRHYYFLSTQEIKNSQDLVGKHIDVRGHGGYVILPPSNHESGKKYAWDTPLDTKIQDMPEWLERIALKHSDVDVSQDFDAAQDAELERGSKAGESFDESQLKTLLGFVSADCDRDTWWQIGAALRKELGDRRGWDVWDEWSRTAPNKYDNKTSIVQWDSFDPTRKGKDGKVISGGTIHYFAKQNGFRGFDAEAADKPEIRESWLYAASIDRFVETNRLIEWKKEQYECDVRSILHARRCITTRLEEH